jgi:hypothetical protein
MSIKFDYLAHPHSSGYHAKRLVKWLELQTNSKSSINYQCYKLRSDEQFDCNVDFYHITKVTADDGDYKHYKTIVGDGWYFEEVHKVTIAIPAVTQNLTSSLFSFDDETLALLFRLIWHNWTDFEDNELDE